MPPLHAILYGLIQGLTEFLPVSSSAHLVLLPWFTGWPDPGLAFDVALHWGTLIAALFYFRNDIIQLTRGFFDSLKGGRAPENILPWKIAFATVPGALLGALFEKQADTVFRSPLLISGTLFVMGIVLWISEKSADQNTSINSLSWTKAIVIGISQGLAIVPGVSRSGITISMGLFLGLDRSSAVRYSFLLSIPIIAGAGLLKARHFVHQSIDPSLLLGILSSGLAGLTAIHILVTMVKTRSMLPFVVYRIVLAIVVACAFSFR